MRRCKVTVWQGGIREVPYEYSAPEACEIEYGKAVLFQNEVGPGADVEYEVEVLEDQAAGRWKILRRRANRSAPK